MEGSLKSVAYNFPLAHNNQNLSLKASYWTEALKG